MVNIHELKAKCTKIARLCAPIDTGNLRENGIYAKNNGSNSFKMVWDNNKVPYMNAVNVRSKKNRGFIEKGQYLVRSYLYEVAQNGNVPNTELTQELKTKQNLMDYKKPLFRKWNREILLNNGENFKGREALYRKYKQTLDIMNEKDKYGDSHELEFKYSQQGLNDFKNNYSDTTVDTGLLPIETQTQYGGSSVNDIDTDVEEIKRDFETNGGEESVTQETTLILQPEEKKKKLSPEEKLQRKLEREQRQKEFLMRKRAMAATSALTGFGQKSVIVAGTYTGNKYATRSTSTALSMISRSAAIMLMNPAIGTLYAAGDLAFNIAGNIATELNVLQQARFNRSFRGSMTTSGSRWKR